MSRVDLEKLRILSRFVGGAPPRPSRDASPRGGSVDETFVVDRAPAEGPGAPLALIELPDLHGMLRDGIDVEAVLEVLAEAGTRTSVVHILPILIEGTQSERSAARRALDAIVGRLGGTLG
jgi:hypothetical protein